MRNRNRRQQAQEASTENGSSTQTREEVPDSDGEEVDMSNMSEKQMKKALKKQEKKEARALRQAALEAQEKKRNEKAAKYNEK